MDKLDLNSLAGPKPFGEWMSRCARVKFEFWQRSKGAWSLSKSAFAGLTYMFLVSILDSLGESPSRWASTFLGVTHWVSLWIMQVLCECLWMLYLVEILLWFDMNDVEWEGSDS